MRRPHWTALLALGAMFGSVSGATHAVGTAGCETAPEVLEIARLGYFSAIDRPGSAPVYEVKYRHCGRDYRLLIRQPVAEVMRPEDRVTPIVF